MKKSVILAVLGIAAGAATSYGQGFIQFNSYSAHSSSGYIAQYASGASAGTAVADGYTEVLLYSLTPITEAGTGSSYAALNPGWTVASTGLTGNTGVAGTATGPNLTVQTYTPGTPVYFEFAVYDGAGYGQGTWAGHSASFSQALQTGLGLVWFADGNPSNTSGSGSGFLAPTFNVAAVPEPTTLALAGLGGLASLIALRRKQA